MTDHAWERESNVECVSCPACALTFDAIHVTDSTGEYECPACAQVAAEAEVARLREALDDIEASPEDPLRVQAVAAAALAKEDTDGKFVDGGSVTYRFGGGEWKETARRAPAKEDAGDSDE